ncbi:Alpha-(1,3)-fucosyltransferase C [Halotydeus destructor]|nr:Alpha-(1,3)-fucosyltransferase C [Halotydeus destructor]
MKFRTKYIILFIVICFYLLILKTLTYIGRSKTKYEPLDIPRTGEVKLDSSTDHVVVLWTDFFEADWNGFDRNLTECQVKNCVFTRDRKQLSSAEVLVFHLRDLNILDLPRQHLNGQKWTLYNIEAPPNSEVGRHGVPVFEDQVDWIASYKVDSDVYAPYGRLVPLIGSTVKPRSDPVPFSARTRQVAWFVSNCNTPSHREEYVRQLSQYISVDIYGKCGTFECPRSKGTACFEETAKKYKFYLAFENSICSDYVTEKLFNWLEYPIVPVVMGGANYSSILPPNSFIDALDFTPSALAAYLKTMDEQRYNKYFDWRQSYRVESHDLFCDICHKLNERNEYASDTLLTKSTFTDWWITDSKCRNFSAEQQLRKCC